MQIEGSVALVTGANRGLGAAYAHALLDRGAAKVYAGVRNAGSVTDARLIPVRIDVTDRASIEEAVAAAPDVTLLINNAGVDTHTPTLGDEAGLREELEVNYLGPVAVSRAFAPVLGANGGGAMINMLSGLAWFTLPTTGGYSSAKAAMWAATNSLRQNLVRRAEDPARGRRRRGPRRRGGRRVRGARRRVRTDRPRRAVEPAECVVPGARGPRGEPVMAATQTVRRPA